MSRNKQNKLWADIQQAFNTGVSYMLPTVVVGGVFIALALSTAEQTDQGMVITSQFMENLNALGSAGFAVMLPVLAAYIANSIAGRPALAPGFILGYLANNPVGVNNVQTGFLGAMILGVLVGYFVNWCKKWQVPSTLRTIMPILIIPIVSVLTVGMFYIYVMANPIGALMDALVKTLGNLQGGSALVLGAIIGAMTAFDMGGPVNKTATAFTLALMSEGIYAPNGAHRVACAIPPLAMGLSALVSRKKYSSADRDLGISAIFMGVIGITEGAIPFAVKDMKRVLPAIMIGSAVGGAISMMQNVETLVPHGGLVVLPAVNNKVWYVIAMLIGVLVSAAILHLTKPDLTEEN